MIGVGVIGYGYWGPNLVRNFAEIPGSKVIAVSDLRPERLLQVEARYPAIATTRDYRDLLANPEVDAIVIATPVVTHFDITKKVLQAGKHALVEKPLAATSNQVEHLIEEAAKRRLALMVDHTFIYNGAVRKIKELVDSDEIGQVYYYDSVRINLGLFQSDVNVLWDLAVHDLSIMDYVLDAQPYMVSSTGIAHITGQPENVTYLTCFFESNLIAHIHVNWLAPAKIRQTLIGGARRMIVYNDLEPSEKVRIYDKGVTVQNEQEGIYKLLVDYRVGDMWAPQLDRTEALRVEALEFVACIEQNRVPLTDGESGLRVVKILEAATQSLAQQGRPVDVR